jgi:hypothetical protein
MYDYLLRGTRNFAIDRATVDAVLRTNPEIRFIAQQNRAFMGRAVRLLTRYGVRRFLDIGSGIPTQDNVHEVAQAIDESAEVVYIDHDPLAVTYGKEILGDAPGVEILCKDLCHPEDILGDERVQQLLAPGKPVAVLLVATLHFVDDAAYPAVDEIMKAAPPGSYLVLTHLTPRPGEYDAAIEETADQVNLMHLRPPEAVERFFAGLEYIPPGLVEVRRWRPDTPRVAEATPEDQMWMVAGVARKPRLI